MDSSPFLQKGSEWRFIFFWIFVDFFGLPRKALPCSQWRIFFEFFVNLRAKNKKRTACVCGFFAFFTKRLRMTIYLNFRHKKREWIFLSKYPPPNPLRKGGGFTLALRQSRKGVFRFVFYSKNALRAFVDTSLRSVWRVLGFFEFYWICGLPRICYAKSRNDGLFFEFLDIKKGSGFFFQNTHPQPPPQGRGLKKVAPAHTKGGGFFTFFTFFTSLFLF